MFFVFAFGSVSLLDSTQSERPGRTKAKTMRLDNVDGAAAPATLARLTALSLVRTDVIVGRRPMTRARRGLWGPSASTSPAAAPVDYHCATRRHRRAIGVETKRSSDVMGLISAMSAVAHRAPRPTCQTFVTHTHTNYRVICGVEARPRRSEKPTPLPRFPQFRHFCTH